MKNKAFTLIELLAVIIILGILMLIAIPSVTNYINNSRKSTYVTTVNELIRITINKVNSGDLNMFDTDTTYYVPCTCLKLENGEAKSPYGKFDPAYVVVTFDGENYHYYFTGKDVQNMGVPTLTSADILSKESIVANVDAIDTTVGIEGTSNVYVFSDECNGEGEVGPAGTTVPGGSSGGSSSGGSTTFKGMCKKAKTLHTATCTRTTSSGCGGTVGNGNTITYGTLPNGTPKGGDAYDCDVNNDGTYDAAKERFYYVTSDGDNSILLYYTNMNNQTNYSYDSSNQNYHGPRNAYQYLPSTTEWKNTKLIAPSTRSIKNESGNGTTYSGSYSIESFTYTNKAARFLTYQELRAGCGTGSGYSSGYFDQCKWMLENLGNYEANSGSYGYWLENPYSSSSSDVWYARGDSRLVSYHYASYSSGYGVRPAITVKTTDIES